MLASCLVYNIVTEEERKAPLVTETWVSSFVPSLWLPFSSDLQLVVFHCSTSLTPYCSPLSTV